MKRFWHFLGNVGYRLSNLACNKLDAIKISESLPPGTRMMLMCSRPGCSCGGKPSLVEIVRYNVDADDYRIKFLTGVRTGADDYATLGALKPVPPA